MLKVCVLQTGYAYKRSKNKCFQDNWKTKMIWKKWYGFKEGL
jgi:hypothetical protein